MLLGAVVAAATQLSVVRCNVIHRDGGAILWVGLAGMDLALAVEALWFHSALQTTSQHSKNPTWNQKTPTCKVSSCRGLGDASGPVSVN